MFISPGFLPVTLQLTGQCSPQWHQRSLPCTGVWDCDMTVTTACMPADASLVHRNDSEDSPSSHSEEDPPHELYKSG